MWSLSDNGNSDGNHQCNVHYQDFFAFGQVEFICPVNLLDEIKAIKNVGNYPSFASVLSVSTKYFRATY